MTRSTAPSGTRATHDPAPEEVLEPARPLELPDLRSRFTDSVDADQATPA